MTLAVIGGEGLFAASPNASAIPSVYSVTAVPLPAGTSSARVFGINNSGQVVGFGMSGYTYVPFIGMEAYATPIPFPPGLAPYSTYMGGSTMQAKP